MVLTILLVDFLFLSRVWNIIDGRPAISIMWLEFLARYRLKMTARSSGFHSRYLRNNLWNAFRFCEFIVSICWVVSRFKTKTFWLIRYNCKFILVFLYSSSLINQFFHFICSERLWISCSASEWHLIIRILRTFLMKNVHLAVVPIWILLFIRTFLVNWLVFFKFFADFGFSTLSFCSIMNLFGMCLFFHSVRIYDFSFLFEIEGFLMGDNFYIFKLVACMMLTVRWEKFWIGVTHKSVWAARLFGRLISCLQLLEWRIFLVY